MAPTAQRLPSEGPLGSRPCHTHFRPWPLPGRACRHVWSGRRKCACVELRDGGPDKWPSWVCRGVAAGFHLDACCHPHQRRFSSGVLSRSWHNSYSSLAVFVGRLTLFTKINNKFVSLDRSPDAGTDVAFPRKAQRRACHTAGA